MRDYNHILSADFLAQDKKQKPTEIEEVLQEEMRKWERLSVTPFVIHRTENAIKAGKYLEDLLNQHITASKPDIHMSPAVSTSLTYSTAEEFADGMGLGDTTEETHHGVVVTAKLPQHGIIFSPDAHLIPLVKGLRDLREEEVLIMGGLDPNSIVHVEVFDGYQLVIEIIRNQENEIVFTNHENGATTTYVFNEYGNLQPK